MLELIEAGVLYPSREQAMARDGYHNLCILLEGFAVQVRWRRTGSMTLMMFLVDFHRVAN